MIIMAVAMVGCGEDGSNQDDTTEITENTTEQLLDTEESKDTEQVTDNSLATEDGIKEFVMSCDPLIDDYKDILRYEDNYKGKNYFIDIKVAQIMDDGSLRAYFDNDNNDIIISDKREYDTTKILTDDEIRLYGTYEGAGKVTRALTSTDEEIPMFTMYAADINGAVTMPGSEMVGTDVADSNIQDDVTSTNLNSTSSDIKASDLAGYYVGEQNNLDINIYSSPDGDEIGNWNYADDSGYIVAIDDGDYLLCGEYYRLVLSPRKEGDQIIVELWSETGGELWETLTMTEHYES